MNKDHLNLNHDLSLGRNEGLSCEAETGRVSIRVCVCMCVCVQYLSPSSLGMSEQLDSSSSQARRGRLASDPRLGCSLPDRMSCRRMAGSYGLISNFRCT